jgi:translation initiation factor 3 subunit L
LGNRDRHTPRLLVTDSPTIARPVHDREVLPSINMSTFQNGMAPIRSMGDDSDVEEEALVADYKEQVQYEDLDELEPAGLSMAQQTDDIQSRLAQAAQPLDFSAPLEAKFQSYDQYCSLFHFILNSEGPVDLEPPSVRLSDPRG